MNNRSRSVLVTLILISMGAYQAYGQSKRGGVKGSVTSDGEPLPGVNIYIKGTQKGNSTNRDGSYSIDKITEGKHTLIASFVGFKKVKREFNIKPGENTTIDVEMRQSTASMQQMVVTGNARKTYVKDSPVKVDAIKPRRLIQSKVSSNIMDLIGSVSGLTTQLNCGVCNTNAIRINGIEGPNTAVLIDGMPMMGPLSHVYGLNSINPSLIERLEVIKGPQSTLYGSEALGGVVNIITKNTENTPTLSANVYRNTIQANNLDLSAATHSKRFDALIGGNGFYSDSFSDKNGDNFNDHTNKKRVTLFGKGNLRAEDGQKVLSIAAKYYNENRTGGVKGFSNKYRGTNILYGESIYTRRASVLADYRPQGFKQKLRIKGSFSYHDQDSRYGTESYIATQNIGFAQATWDESITENVQLLSGLTYRYKNYDDNTPATSAGTEAFYTPGAFAQADWTFGDFLARGGFRLDHHSEQGWVSSPRLSVKYNPSELTTLRVNYGTGFRVVNVFTEDHAALTGSRQVIFAEELKPEKAKSITASIEHIISFGANPLTVSIDGFYTKFSNKIIPDYDQDPNKIVYENLEGFSATRGFSIGLDQNFTSLPISYDASFTLTDVYTDENGTKRAITYAPNFTGNLGLTYRIKQADMSLNYEANLTGPKRMPDFYVNKFGRDQFSSTFTTHNFKITKEFSDVNTSKNGIGFEAYFSAENIFDFTQGSPLVDAGNPFSDDFDTIYTWGPVWGRTLTLGARLNIR